MTEPTTAAGRRGERNGACCGKPVQCSIQSDGCPWMTQKRRRMRLAATKPTCAVCGQGEQSSRHLSIHPEYHPFTEAQSA